MAAERMLIFRLPWDSPLTRAGRNEPSAAEPAADLCRHRGTPVALLTNGNLWALVHARPDETTTTAVFDADLWLDERDLLRAFASLLGARRVLPPPKRADGEHSESLAALFARSAEAQAEVTNTLGVQVRQAVELLVGELSRLDRESAGAVLGQVAPREVYRGALTVMMRLVFLLYAEEQRLLPVTADLYASAYSVIGLHDQLDAEKNRYGEEIGDRRAAAWPRLLATFAAVYGGCEYDEMRIPPYGGSLFDPARYPWLERLAVTDRVVHEILGALLVLRRRGGAAERLSYKGLDVEQIGHVYEGLLEFSCLRVDEPYLGLIGKNEPELALAEVEEACEDIDTVFDWLAAACGTSVAAVRKAMASAPRDEAALHAACDNDAALVDRVRPLHGLLRTDLRGLPTVFPAGSLVVTQVGDRRATGTHYTPRALAEEIVQYTLAPLCYSPGPADGADETDWQVLPADRLLDLKVLDPAMGSGAFLVSACRYLAERVVTAWERDGYPDPVLAALGPNFDRDDAIREAKRRVAARCLYGVDRDEAALELGKLSLWLVTLAKDKPFSFLDHALRCGDSLVGLISESQVEAFHLDPETGRRINARLSGAIDEIAGPILTRVRELREEIEAEPVRDAHQADVLAGKLQQAERLTTRLRDLADAVVASALSTAGQSDDAFDDRLTAIADEVLQLLSDDVDSPLEGALHARLRPWLQGARSVPLSPLHWPLEFPEVMYKRGFNAIVSNPPFMGGPKISGTLGGDYREYLKNYLISSTVGNADLCSYFLRRYVSLTSAGRVGIIATNTIAQGDTREVGLEKVVDFGWTVYRAETSQPWPGTASLEVSLVWVGHPGRDEERILNDAQVVRITSSLHPESRVDGTPHRLYANARQSFEGSKLTGTGFILKPEEARELLSKDSKNAEALFLYLSGDDLNSRWDSSAARWAIDFHDWPLDKAAQYTDLFAIVDRKVRPIREKNNRKLRRERWWQYGERAPGLYNAIAGLDSVFAITLHTKIGLPLRVPSRQIFSHGVGVFATDRAADLALFSSAIHFIWWTTKAESTLVARLRYTPSDGFETFPQPRSKASLEGIGQRLDEFRQSVMERQRLGLTDLYNRVYDRHDDSTAISALREIHIAIDITTRNAYAEDEELEPAIREFESRTASAPLPSWRDVNLNHGFYDSRQGPIFTISPEARNDVLDKLLALNHYRYQQEVEQGLHSGKRRRASKKRAAGQATTAASMFDDGALFRPEGTMF